jgi:hypothetical protein
MAIYDKDKRFSVGWMVGGTIIMAVFSLLSVGLVGAIAGITMKITELTAENVTLLAFGLWVLSFVVGGILIGWKSEGQTILEAGIAAAAGEGLVILLNRAVNNVDLSDASPLVLGLVYGIPFVAGILGGFVGEKFQGDTVTTADD